MADGSVVEVTVLRDGQTSKYSDKGEEYHIKYQVVCDDNWDDGSGMEQATVAMLDYLDWTSDSVPTYPGRSGESPDDPLLLPMYAINMSGSMKSDGPPVYVFDVKYAVAPYGSLTIPPSYSSTPWQQPCQIKWTVRPYTIVAAVDTSGNAIVNSAGDRFVPPLEVEEYHPVCSIIRNEYSSGTGNEGPGNLSDYINTVNDAGITIAGMVISEGYAKITNLAIVRKDFQGTPYYEITYEIELHPDSWDFDVLSEGFNYKDTNGNLQKCRDGELPADEPKLLDADGFQVEEDSSSEFLGYFISYLLLEEEDFSALTLPVNMNSTGILP